MMMPGEKFKSAQEFFNRPEITPGDRLNNRNPDGRDKSKMDHNRYMDFAELYADYVVEYEKVNSK